MKRTPYRCSAKKAAATAALAASLAGTMCAVNAVVAFADEVDANSELAANDVSDPSEDKGTKCENKDEFDKKLADANTLPEGAENTTKTEDGSKTEYTWDDKDGSHVRDVVVSEGDSGASATVDEKTTKTEVSTEGTGGVSSKDEFDKKLEDIMSSIPKDAECVTSEDGTTKTYTWTTKDELGREVVHTKTVKLTETTTGDEKNGTVSEKAEVSGSTSWDGFMSNITEPTATTKEAYDAYFAEHPMPEGTKGEVSEDGKTTTYTWYDSDNKKHVRTVTVDGTTTTVADSVYTSISGEDMEGTYTGENVSTTYFEVTAGSSTEQDAVQAFVNSLAVTTNFVIYANEYEENGHIDGNVMVNKLTTNTKEIDWSKTYWDQSAGDFHYEYKDVEKTTVETLKKGGYTAPGGYVEGLDGYSIIFDGSGLQYGTIDGGAVVVAGNMVKTFNLNGGSKDIIMPAGATAEEYADAIIQAYGLNPLSDEAKAMKARILQEVKISENLQAIAKAAEKLAAADATKATIDSMSSMSNAMTANPGKEYVIKLNVSDIDSGNFGNAFRTLITAAQRTGSTLIINVDTSSYGEHSIIKIDEPLAGIAAGDYEACNENIVWNFGSFSGTVVFNKAHDGIVVAPNATVDTMVMDGRIVANKVIQEGGQEIHQPNVAKKDIPSASEDSYSTYTSGSVSKHYGAEDPGVEFSYSTTVKTTESESSDSFYYEKEPEPTPDPDPDPDPTPDPDPDPDPEPTPDPDDDDVNGEDDDPDDDDVNGEDEEPEEENEVKGSATIPQTGDNMLGLAGGATALAGAAALLLARLRRRRD